jgi:hypothetical protein
MFSNGVAGMMSPMGGVGPSPMPLNFAYGPGPVRYPSQVGTGRIGDGGHALMSYNLTARSTWPATIH